jgi:benzoate membrane transport protein
VTGVAMLVLAPFGAFALCLSAITAAICMGREAHEDTARRYTAAVSCGVLYVLIGIFGAAVTAAHGLPQGAGRGHCRPGPAGHHRQRPGRGTCRRQAHREAALITFLVTLSGVSIAGIGSAFWGVVAGAMALFVQQYGRRNEPKP